MIYIWQQMVATHMAGLAKALVSKGHRVTFVTNMSVKSDRAAQGWDVGDVGGARLVFATTSSEIQEVAAAAPEGAIHITQGLRRNGLVGEAQRALRARGARIWLIHEKVDHRGMRGLLRRVTYSLGYRKARPWAERLLAIGDGTDRWAAAHGFPKSRTTPFAYFLEQDEPAAIGGERPFTFCYAGRLIKLKRVDLIIEALSSFGHQPWALDVVGDGPLGLQLRERAGQLGNIRWHGTIANKEARKIIAQSDCLVLPSDYDGWGAVVSEALLSGTRAICSSACGSATVVREDNASRVFQTGDTRQLHGAIAETLGMGKVSPKERRQRRKWAVAALSASAGADYLEELINGKEVLAPWKRHRQPGATT